MDSSDNFNKAVEEFRKVTIAFSQDSQAIKDLSKYFNQFSKAIQGVTGSKPVITGPVTKDGYVSRDVYYPSAQGDSIEGLIGKVSESIRKYSAKGDQLRVSEPSVAEKSFIELNLRYKKTADEAERIVSELGGTLTRIGKSTKYIAEVPYGSDVESGKLSRLDEYRKRELERNKKEREKVVRHREYFTSKEASDIAREEVEKRGGVFTQKSANTFESAFTASQMKKMGMKSPQDAYRDRLKEEGIENVERTGKKGAFLKIAAIVVILKKILSAVIDIGKAAIKTGQEYISDAVLAAKLGMSVTDMQKENKTFSSYGASPTAYSDMARAFADFTTPETLSKTSGLIKQLVLAGYGSEGINRLVGLASGKGNFKDELDRVIDFFVGNIKSLEGEERDAYTRRLANLLPNVIADPIIHAGISGASKESVGSSASLFQPTKEEQNVAREFTVSINASISALDNFRKKILDDLLPAIDSLFKWLVKIIGVTSKDSDYYKRNLEEGFKEADRTLPSAGPDYELIKESVKAYADSLTGSKGFAPGAREKIVALTASTGAKVHSNALLKAFDGDNYNEEEATKAIEKAFELMFRKDLDAGSKRGYQFLSASSGSDLINQSDGFIPFMMQFYGEDALTMYRYVLGNNVSTARDTLLEGYNAAYDKDKFLRTIDRAHNTKSAEKHERAAIEQFGSTILDARELGIDPSSANSYEELKALVDTEKARIDVQRKEEVRKNLEKTAKGLGIKVYKGMSDISLMQAIDKKRREETRYAETATPSIEAVEKSEYENFKPSVLGAATSSSIPKVAVVVEKKSDILLEVKARSDGDSATVGTISTSPTDGAKFQQLAVSSYGGIAGSPT